VEARKGEEAQRKNAQENEEKALKETKKAKDAAISESEARKAEQRSKKKAEINLGHSLFAQGDALFRSGRYGDSRVAYEKARRWFLETGQPTPGIDAALAYQDRSAVPPVALLNPHVPGDLVAAMSPDARWVLVAGNDGILRRADRADNYAFKELGRHSDWITAIAVSRDSRIALTAGRDGIMKLWDLELGKEKLAVKASHLPLWAVALSPTGQVALSGGDDFKVRVWDLENGTLQAVLADHEHPHREWIAALGFSADGRIAFSGSRDGAMKLWKVADWSFVRSIGTAESLTSAAITDDGVRIVSIDEEGYIYIWDTHSGEEVSTTAPSGTDLAHVVVLLPESRLGISGGAFGGAGLAFVGGKTALLPYGI
jgi:WD40 repeat protein